MPCASSYACEQSHTPLHKKEATQGTNKVSIASANATTLRCSTSEPVSISQENSSHSKRRHIAHAMTPSTNNEAQMEFDSEGFDLDAVLQDQQGKAQGANDGDDADVVYEVGGKASASLPPVSASAHAPKATEAASCDKAQDGRSNDSDNGNGNVKGEAPCEEQKEDEVTAPTWKARGNAYFQQRLYEDAIDSYTKAIQIASMDAAIAIDIDEIIASQIPGDDANQPMDADQDALGRRLRPNDPSGRNQKVERGNSNDMEADATSPNASVEAIDDGKRNGHDDGDAHEKLGGQGQARAGWHRLVGTDAGNELAVYFGNRAAAAFKLDRVEDVIRDSSVAVCFNPGYAKAFVRRSAAQEKLEKTDLALQDARQAQHLEPRNAEIKALVERLQREEDARMEKLKAETLGKLKDLGNSILGNFGLSVDNFEAVKDPTTGSYNIKFNQ